MEVTEDCSILVDGAELVLPNSLDCSPPILFITTGVDFKTEEGVVASRLGLNPETAAFLMAANLPKPVDAEDAEDADAADDEGAKDTSTIAGNFDCVAATFFPPSSSEVFIT